MRTFLLAFFSITFLNSCNAQENVIFFDDFEGEELDMKSWNYVEGDGCPDLCGWGNNEEQIYTRDNVKLRDGNLVITASKKDGNYYSGRINSKDKIEFKYGTIEVRANVAEAKGLWPAAWMLGHDIDEVSWPASGEIDMVEYIGREPDVVFNSLHTPASHGNTINTRKTKIEGISKGFHVFKTVWTKDSIEFIVDGESLYTFTPKNYTSEEYPFRKEFYLLFNMAIGGNLGGAKIDDAALPEEFIVDYIKVTQNSN